MQRLWKLAAPLALLSILAPAALAGGDEPFEVRDYQVDALVRAVRETELERIGLERGASWDEYWGDDDSKEGTAGYHQFVDDDGLVELIVESVAPASWDEEGAEIELVGGRLVVSARRDVQRAIEALLADLWSAAMRRVRVDVHFVRLSAEAQKGLKREGVLAPLLAGRLTSAQVGTVHAAAGPGVSGATVSRPARRATIRHLDSVSYVRDFDVEIAQGSIVGDPMVGFVRQGLLVDVRPHLLTDGSVFLEALGQSASALGALRRVDLEADALGALDLPACRVSRFFAAGRVAPGETMAILRREASGALAVTFLTPRVTPRGAQRSALSLFPVSALTWYRFGYEVTDRTDETDKPPERFPPRLVLHGGMAPYVDWDGLLELVRARALSEAREDDPLVWPLGTRICTLADPALVGEVRGQIAALEDLATRTWRVHVKLTETGDETRPREIAAFHLDAAAGRRVCYSAGVERAYVADWDVEVAQESRIGDPEVGRAYGGVTVNLRLDGAGSPGEVAARLEMLLSELAPEFETRRTGNAVTGIIEIPRMARVRLERDLLLETGETTVIDGGRLASGKGLRVELTVERR
jgi:hypothetical protein